MEFDLNRVREEFESIKRKKGEEETCSLTCGDDGVEGEGFIETLQKELLPPARSGIYLSRLDLKVIGLEFGEDVQIRERKRMLRDILRAVTSKEELERLFSIINRVADEKIAIYRELATHFPHSWEIWEWRIERNRELRALMERILTNFEGGAPLSSQES
ncbi:MAG: hypothetical protein GXO19_03745 [Epsilonproteobacteria bacterium]|nr:hypothetical protein [Campylobacterota bacterium]